MHFYIYTDGAARGNPGESASGYMIFDASKKVVVKKSFYTGKQTNNVAEYLAIIAALKKVAEEYGPLSEIELFSDSTLVVNQLRGEYKINVPRLRELCKEALGVAKKFKSCKFANLPRETREISMVDGELNRLLDNYKKDDAMLEELKGNTSQRKL